MMKLSEAIRLGIGAVKNDASVFLIERRKEGPCGCAIGTALYSVGEKYSCEGIADCERYWPWTKKDDISFQISSRHFKGESRESIAAWIETIEPQEAKCTTTQTTQTSQQCQGECLNSSIKNQEMETNQNQNLNQTVS
jgi:hypothetical protein